MCGTTSACCAMERQREQHGCEGFSSGEAEGGRPPPHTGSDTRAAQQRWCGTRGSVRGRSCWQATAAARRVLRARRLLAALGPMPGRGRSPGARPPRQNQKPASTRALERKCELGPPSRWRQVAHPLRQLRASSASPRLPQVRVPVAASCGIRRPCEARRPAQPSRPPGGPGSMAPARACGHSSSSSGPCPPRSCTSVDHTG